jgi:hypothetical protein
VLATRIARAEEGPKDPDTAFWLSAGGAITSVVLAGAGGALYAATADHCSGSSCQSNPHDVLHGSGEAMLDIGLATSAVSPMLGHFYSHHYFTAGLGLRVAGATVALVGNFNACNPDQADFGTCPPTQTNYTAIVLGALLFSGGMLYDVATAKREARAYNRDHAPHAMIVPTALRDARSTGYGLAVGGTF